MTESTSTTITASSSSSLIPAILKKTLEARSGCSTTNYHAQHEIIEFQFVFVPLQPIHRTSLYSWLNEHSNGSTKDWDALSSKQLRELALQTTDAVTCTVDIQRALALLLIADHSFDYDKENGNNNNNNPCPFNIAATLLTLDSMMSMITMDDCDEGVVKKKEAQEKVSCNLKFMSMLYSTRHIRTIDPSDASTWYLFTSVYATQLPLRVMVCVLQQLVLFWSTPTSSPCNATIAEDIEASVVGSNININININIGKARASHLLASLTDEGPEATGASAVYVRAVFDHLASDFEHRLVEVLEYSVPWLLREQLRDYCNKSNEYNTSTLSNNWVVLDLGCGSGLVGRVFADLCRRPCEAVEILIADMTDLWRQIGVPWWLLLLLWRCAQYGCCCCCGIGSV